MDRHEGKACDAVARRIEAREGGKRSDPRFPEKEKHPAPVDFTCRIANRLFALEHTLIEPFEDHIELVRKAQAHFDPIRERLAGALPQTEHFVLHLPVKAMLKLKGRELERIQAAIVDWASCVAPTLPIARRDNWIFDLTYQPIRGVPFEVALHRVTIGGPVGQLSVVHLVDRDIEEQRTSRIRAGCNKHLPKLAFWREKHDARSVLILEHCDIQFTDAELIYLALVKIEQEASDKPDEVYLLSSADDKRWPLYALRIEERGYYELSQSNECRTEIDPATLNDLTNR